MTSFDNIYSLFFSQIDDYELGAMTESDALEFLYNQLLISIVEFKKCKKDLTKLTPFSLGKLAINFNGNTEVSIIEDLAFIHKNLNFTITNGDTILKENSDYSIRIENDSNMITDIIITKLNKELPDILQVNWYFSGEFEETLDIEEQYILALGMLNSWLNHKIFRERNLRQTIGDIDYKGYSSANLLAKLTLLQAQTIQQLKIKKVNYSYNNFNGLD